jgi:hypothetical protein
VHGSRLIVGEWRGHAARFVGAAREWKRYWRSKRNGKSITRVLKRVSTGRYLGCVLMRLWLTEASSTILRHQPAAFAGSSDGAILRATETSTVSAPLSCTVRQTAVRFRMARWPGWWLRRRSVRTHRSSRTHCSMWIRYSTIRYSIRSHSYSGRSVRCRTLRSFPHRRKRRSLPLRPTMADHFDHPTVVGPT